MLIKGHFIIRLKILEIIFTSLEVILNDDRIASNFKIYIYIYISNKMMLKFFLRKCGYVNRIMSL